MISRIVIMLLFWHYPKLSQLDPTSPQIFYQVEAGHRSPSHLILVNLLHSYPLRIHKYTIFSNCTQPTKLIHVLLRGGGGGGGGSKYHQDILTPGSKYCTIYWPRGQYKISSHTGTPVPARRTVWTTWDCSHGSSVLGHNPKHINQVRME